MFSNRSATLRAKKQIRTEQIQTKQIKRFLAPQCFVYYSRFVVQLKSREFFLFQSFFPLKGARSFFIFAPLPELALQAHLRPRQSVALHLGGTCSVTSGFVICPLEGPALSRPPKGPGLSRPVLSFGRFELCCFGDPHPAAWRQPPSPARRERALSIFAPSPELACASLHLFPKGARSFFYFCSFAGACFASSFAATTERGPPNFGETSAATTERGPSISGKFSTALTHCFFTNLERFQAVFEFSQHFSRLPRCLAEVCWAEAVSGGSAFGEGRQAFGVEEKKETRGQAAG